MMQTSKKHKYIEGAKNVILVVLFLSTILLLYGFWWNVKPGEINIESIGPQNGVYETFKVEEVIAPAVIEISYGDGRFGVINQDTRKYWWNPQGASFTGAMNQFFASGSIFVESITKEQYQEVLSRESIKFIFDYDLPFKELCKLYKIPQSSAMANISNFSEIAYSFGSMESFFIHDGKEEGYYRIVGEGDFMESTSLASIYEELSALAYIAYPLNKLVGEESKNAILVPLPSEFSYTISTYKNERTVGGREFERTLAKTFFGDTFDFTRVIEDAKGGVTYMYGYGERVFIAENDGSFRYKIESVPKKPLSDLDSLEIALDFIARHGGTRDPLEDKQEIRLFKIKREEGKAPKISFYFQIQKDEPILYESGAPFIVECTGDTVTSFYRDLFILGNLQKRLLPAGEYTAINVLAKNYEAMGEVLEAEGLIEFKNGEAFQAVSDSIKGIRLVETRFKKNKEGVGKIENCWSFSFRSASKTVEFYYSIRDALPMGYSVR